MSDDLERVVGAVEGEGPSPEFVARLREQVVAELSGSESTGEHASVAPIDIQPEQEEHVMTRTRLILAGLAAALIAVIVGVVALGGEERGLETITETEESTTTEPSTTEPSDTEPSDTEPPTTAVSTTEPATFAPDATPLPRQFGSIQPGSYRAEDFLRPLAFAIEQSMILQQNGPTRIAISNPSSRDPGDKDIVFMTLPVDYDQWLDLLANGVAELDVEEAMLGELRVARVDIDEVSCVDDPPFCPGSGTAEAGMSNLFTEGALYRIWVVDNSDGPSMAVIAGIWNESDIIWFDVAEKVVSTLEFAPVDDG